MRRKRPRNALNDDSAAIAYADALLQGLARAHSRGYNYDSAPPPNSIRGWPVWPATPPDLANDNSVESERMKPEQWWMRGMQAAMEAINYKVTGDGGGWIMSWGWFNRRSYRSVDGWTDGI